MKIKKVMCLVISLLMIIGIFPTQAFAVQDKTSDSEGNFSKDRVLVKLANNSYTDTTNEITCDLFGISCTEIRLLNPSESKTSQGDDEYSTADITDTQNNVFVLMLEETGTKAIENALEILNDNPIVEIAEPDYIGEYTAVPNDPDYYLQYAAMECISAPEAWDYTKGDNSVVVGIIDSGIQGTHPDLYDNLWNNPNPNKYGYINDIHGYNFEEKTGGIPTDAYGHGTHIAGIVGASGNNEEGISGINWDVSLAWLQVGTLSPTTEFIIEALNYANLHNIAITNNSYTVDNSKLLEEAVKNYDGLFVASAGNGFGLNIDEHKKYPASFDFPNVITVASTDSFDQLSDLSNFGPESVDLAAPGSGIYSTFINPGYAYMSGTSMAAAQVTGVAALLKSKYPNLSAAQIKAAILNGVDVLPQLDGVVSTGGRLNAYKALLAAENRIYTVVYDKNGGSGNMSDTVITYGTYQKLRKNTYTKTGYVFYGWYGYRKSDNKWLYDNGTSYCWCLEGSEPSGYKKHIYKDEITVGKSTDVNNDTIIMYAQWLRNGDVNQDGSLNIDDVTMLQKYIANIVDFTDTQLLVADFNGDGVINIDDATAIQSFIYS